MKETKTITLVHIEEKCLDELKRLAEIGFQVEKSWERLKKQEKQKYLVYYQKKGEPMKKKTKTVKKVKKTKTKTNKS